MCMSPASTAVWVFRLTCVKHRMERKDCGHICFAFGFCVCGRQKPEDPNLCPVADDAITRGGHTRSGISLVICEAHVLIRWCMNSILLLIQPRWFHLVVIWFSHAKIWINYCIVYTDEVIHTLKLTIKGLTVWKSKIANQLFSWWLTENMAPLHSAGGQTQIEVCRIIIYSCIYTCRHSAVFPLWIKGFWVWANSTKFQCCGCQPSPHNCHLVGKIDPSVYV